MAIIILCSKVIIGTVVFCLVVYVNRIIRQYSLVRIFGAHALITIILHDLICKIFKPIGRAYSLVLLTRTKYLYSIDGHRDMFKYYYNTIYFARMVDVERYRVRENFVQYNKWTGVRDGNGCATVAGIGRVAAYAFYGERSARALLEHDPLV